MRMQMVLPGLALCAGAIEPGATAQSVRRAADAPNLLEARGGRGLSAIDTLASLALIGALLVRARVVYDLDALCWSLLPVVAAGALVARFVTGRRSDLAHALMPTRPTHGNVPEDRA